VSDFDAALERYKKVGAANAADPDLMAAFCKNPLQHIVGAVSSKLVWEGAMKRGMTSQQLAELANRHPLAVADLQWI
jgi:hypothetical protein